MEPIAALAELARRAVMPAELGRVLQDAVELVAETLDGHGRALAGQRDDG